MANTAHKMIISKRAGRMDRSYAKGRYHTQKGGAKSRGIAFLITFDDWYDWFLSQGVDRNIPQGNKGSSYAMCRYDDIGPYELGNIYLGTQSSNVKDMNERTRRRMINTPDGIMKSEDAAIFYNVSRCTIYYRAGKEIYGFSFKDKPKLEEEA